jgi:glycosyltransferase involved in cell wall biosynthesis
MNSRPTLSVVLPNYNHGKFIARALEALLAQELTADEIIVVDDGSTDDSRDIIGRFAAKAASIRILVNRQNQGVIPALIRGLEAASGDYVYFAAADDWVMPGFLKLAVGALEAHPQLGLFCGEAVLLDRHTNEPFGIRPIVRPVTHAGPVTSASACRLLKRTDNWILTGSSVFRRVAVTWAGGLDPRLGSFADGFLARKLALSYGFYYAPQVVATWVVYSDSVSRRTALDPVQARHALEAVPERLAADSVFPKWYPRVFQNRWRFATSRLALEAEPINYKQLWTMGVRTLLDRIVLVKICPHLHPRLARLTALTWLWFRLRPTTLTGLVRTALAFRLRHFRQTSQQQRYELKRHRIRR